MTPCALRDMMKNRTAEHTRHLLGRERHVVESARDKDVALGVVEATIQSPYGVVSVPIVSRAVHTRTSDV